MTKEEKFYNKLKDIFIGAKIEGTGGFINLMKIKSKYYDKIEEILKADIERALEKYPSFRDELFDKLYSFFSRYFTESGSIYFNSTPFHNNIYEKVYTDDRDVILFWKTQMLYYVKTDKIFRSLPVEFDGLKFFFDASTIENKKANEKRSLVFELSEVREDGTIVFAVQYSERGIKTKQGEILKAIKKKGIAITEEQLERAFRIFEKQSEVDFFINKNAKAFLQEQFKLWSYQYFWEGAREWSADRVNELQILKDIAFKIIDFISQFEDELVKIWNKPKFVKNSNYVITLDRIGNLELIEQIFKHKNIQEQIKEWQELGIVEENFKVKDVFETDLTGKQLAKKYEHLPIDTKYFKDLELEILSQFEDLDKSLDGWLIKSENYQALNTILPKFKEKVQTIYIDPPFNTGEDFPYVDRFQDSSWLSLMNDRLNKSKEIMNKSASFYINLDINSNFRGRELLEHIFGKDNFMNEIVWNTACLNVAGFKTQANNWIYSISTIYYYAKHSMYVKFKKLNYQLPDFIKKFFKFEGEDELGKFRISRYGEKIYLENEMGDRITNIWNDIMSFNYASIAADESLKFPTQKPEKLLQRIIEASSDKDDIILDFFLGSGTTTAVSHKLGRKWIGVEMGEHFYSVVLPRMKKVLAYDKSGISKEVKEYQGGGFFKYYELEQYEEALANCVYENHDLLIAGNKSPYEQYVFLKDEKMLKALEIDYENNKVKVDLSKLYENIDIAETLSNLYGKWIKRISDEEVEFEDGTKINIKDLDYKLIKPLIWWE
ncbi:MAG: site-specific DNA-methyltransferase [Ignavibacteria bacterium]|jgi:adenine specific DNA methylase Mod|nr:site-specific DNA-methyltransferase [Ignavibacteria bacterium]MDH7527293.1 site-specific DNA-methyltransferase [Ignavibacteria bacterium]